MPDLVAQGPQPSERWRRRLENGGKHVIGRTAGQWSTPWDERISRRHVEIVYEAGQLTVEILAGARNPIFFRGHKTDQFTLRAGDHFVIGKTTFSLVEERVNVSLDMPAPAGERTFSVEELRRQPFRETDKRIDVLGRLPDIISGSASDQELVVRLVNLLLSGVERATAAAIVSLKTPIPPPNLPSPQPLPSVEVLHWDRRILAGTDFRPSERLIRQAVESAESVAHIWSTPTRSVSEARPTPTRSVSEGLPTQARSVSEGLSSHAAGGEFTVSEGLDWAFCTPVAGRACAGWALYVTGSFATEFSSSERPDAESLRDDMKFAELTATTLSGLRESRLLATRQASLSQFFSPVVLDALGQQEAEDALSPREADVTVLFCDLRGFTEQSERAAGDLFGLLNRVSQALGVMTHFILREGGVVGDFHGDAAMGFWGWPLPQPDAIERACRAAQGIRGAFVTPAVCTPAAEESVGNPITDFRVGIGIASGRAVAGKIGTADQVKVTVFGPVVNLAARLETMTKQLRASILIDPPTAAVIRSSIPYSVCRVRRLARVRPVGIATPLEVSELLPPVSQRPELTDEHIATYEAALDAFQNRDWSLALKLLHAVPPDDVAKDFLTIFIVQHNRTPPPGWDGAIPLEGK